MNWTMLGDITIVLTIVTAVIAGYRFVHKNVLEPVADIRRATTQNTHADPENPTLRDDLGDLKEGVSELNTLLARHLSWSEEEVSRLWKSIGKKADK